jgi:hypothetical protein
MGSRTRRQGADSAAAVDLGRLLHLRGDGEERAPQQPDGERLVERGVQQDKAQQAVCKVHVHHELVDADQQHHGREHLAHNDSAQEKALALEAHAGHGVGRRHAAEDGQRRGAAGGNNGVGRYLRTGALLQMSMKFDHSHTLGNTVILAEYISEVSLAAVTKVTK